MNSEQKRRQEQETVSWMIALYCRRHHGGGPLCPACAALEAYARQRTDRCPFAATKTFCSCCRVHCYRPDMRTQIRQVMRFSGPRMLFHHPLMALRHAAAVIKGGKKTP